jgi:hypothetical protein
MDDKGRQARGDIDDAIDAIADHDNSDNLYLDELEQWRKYEPKWTEKQYNDGNVIRYWIDLAPKYTNLSRLAIDLLTIPASSCECERLFSELGDLLEPRRRKLEQSYLQPCSLYDRGYGEVLRCQTRLRRPIQIKIWTRDLG